MHLQRVVSNPTIALQTNS